MNRVILNKLRFAYKFLYSMVLAILAMLVFGATAKAESLITEIDSSTVSQDGKVYLNFPVQEDLRLLVYKQTSPGDFVLDEGDIIQDYSTGKVEFTAFDPDAISGGDFVEYYFAVITDTEYVSYQASTGATTTEQSDGNIEIKWENIDNIQCSFVGKKEKFTRTTEIKNSTAKNETPGVENPYAFQDGAVLTLSFRANTDHADITQATVQGETVDFTRNDPPDENGFYQYTATASLSADGLEENESEKIEFSFTVNEITIDQDNELVNKDDDGAKIPTLYAILNETDLKAELSVESLMQGYYITPGEDNLLTLTYSGIEREFEFTVAQLSVNGKEITSFTDNGSNVSFYLLGDEGLETDDSLDCIELRIFDEVGNQYTITVANGDEYTYIEPMQQPATYALGFSGDLDGLKNNDTKLAAFANSNIIFTMETDDIYRNAKYVLNLELLRGTEGGGVESVASVDIDLELMEDEAGVPLGSPTEGYTYTASIQAGTEFPLIAQGDEIQVVGITREDIPVENIEYNMTDLPNVRTIVYYSELQFTSVSYEVIRSLNSNTNTPVQNGDLYTVQGDWVEFKIELTHGIENQPIIHIANLTGTKVDENTFDQALQHIGEAPNADTFIYCLDATGMNIRGLFRMPNLTYGVYHETQKVYMKIEAQYADLNDSGRTIQTNETDNFISTAAPKDNVVYWEPVELGQFDFSMTASTKLENKCITKGDGVDLSYSGIHAESIVKFITGQKEIVLAAGNTAIEGTYSFNLTETEQEDYVSNTKMTIVMVVENGHGKIYKIPMPAENAFTYMLRGTPKDQLNFNFTQAPRVEDPAPTHFAVSQYSSVDFTFETNEIYPREYSVILTSENTNVSVEIKLKRVLEPAGGAQTGYCYTGRIDIKDIGGLKDLEKLQAKMTCDAADLRYTDNLTNAKIMYYGDFTLLGLNVAYPESNNKYKWKPSDEFAYIIDNDFIVVTMRFNHSLVPQDTSVAIENIVGVESDKSTLTAFVKQPYNYKAEKQLQYYFDKTNMQNDTIVCLYKVPKIADANDEPFRLSFQRENNAVYDFQDNVPVNITVNGARLQVPGQPVSTQTKDYGSKKNNGEEMYHQIVYWAPLELWNPNVTLKNAEPDTKILMDDMDEDTYVIVRDGQEIRVSFMTKHPIQIDEIGTQFSPDGLSASKSPKIDLLYSEVKDEKARYLYTASYRVGGKPMDEIEDQTVLKYIWNLSDVRGQTNRASKILDEVHWAIYYKPLEITKVTIESSNQQDETQFCKDNDRITVRFEANHFVILEGQTIAGHAGEYSEQRRRHREPKEYQFTYEIQNGDIEDLKFVTFYFKVTDMAKDTFSYEDNSPEVTNRIKYYEPLEVTADIESSNARKEYARNGDTVTVSTKANHEMQTLDFQIGSRTIGDNKAYRENPSVSYRIPEYEEELYEGEVFFSVRLEDPAGNFEIMSKTAEEGKEGTKVTYDRTAPEILIMPGFNGFTNEDVGFSFLFSDAFLDMPTLSCVLNGKEQMNHTGDTETSYTQTIKLSNEGKYVITASAVDMAGNEVEFKSSSHLIIDKTKPVIQMELEKNTFAAGFTLDKITSIEEDYLGDLLCTLSDSQGVQDWALEVPIEEEGRKTVFTVARDMAGNTSIPIVYDLFIDATKPQPVIVNSASLEPLQPSEENFIVGFSAKMDLALAPIFMGDEGPDAFTTLQLMDGQGNLVHDFLSEPAEMQDYSYKLPAFGKYTLLVAAKDDVGNETGPMLYSIEFREKYLLERLLENTPFANLKFIHYINDFMFVLILTGLALLLALAIVLVARHRRKKKEYMAQEYIIVEND